MDEYSHRGAHRPFEDGDPLHALGSMGTFPPDVYEHPEWYSWGEFTDVCAAVIRSARGWPDAPVRIYRAVPAGVTHFEPGDWVTVHLGYARQHAARTNDSADDWPVITAVVHADTVRSGGNDIVEWGYFGLRVVGNVLPPGWAGGR